MPNAGWEAGKLGRVKAATKIFLKRFGPLLITGLAAIAEHQLGHDNEPEDTKLREEPEEPEEPEDRHSIRQLEREVKELKRSLSRKARDEAPREAPPSPRIREEIVREWRQPYQEEQAREQYSRGRALPDDQPGPSSYELYQELPIDQPTYTLRQEASAQFVQVQEREYVRPSHRQHSIQRRRHRRRHASVPNRTSHEDESKHAGKVAVIAGALETIHIDDMPGDWLGPKGVRVGTTMAATYAASRSRDRDPDNFRPREVVVDVGTGLLVSRLVHGSSRRLDENERTERRGRRWSHCY